MALAASGAAVRFAPAFASFGARRTPRTSVVPTGSLSDKAGTAARPHRSALRARASSFARPDVAAAARASEGVGFAGPAPGASVRRLADRGGVRGFRRAARNSARDAIVRRAAVVAAAANEEEYRDDDGAWDDEPTVNIPISFFSILNLSPARASPASIEAAYTAVIQRELVEGFSKACLAARADLVDAAAQVISDPALRIEHESDLKEGRLTPVPASQLGGALALMQEAGEHEAVIEYAPECLAAVKSRSARRDITLSAALAHCELSHNALTATPPRVGEGCELLDIASSILVAEAGPRFSKELQDTINYTLVEMAPAYVIELIAMPLEAKKERKEGVRALRQILWADGDAALADRDAYVVEVNRHLTSSEVVELFLEAPEHIPADAEEVYQSAMAHIVTGYKERRPMLIADADEMLAQLEEAAYTAAAESRAQAEQMSRMAAAAGQPPPAGTWTTPPPAEPVNVERAVCQMLLGRVDDCAYSLGMGADPSPYPLDPQVERFVMDHSPSGDYTEGLCALVDRWIADVAFPSFRDSAKINPVPSIVQWFDEPKVQAFCDRYESSPEWAKLVAGLDNAARAVAKTVENVTDAAAGSAVPGLRADAGSVLGGGGGPGVARSRLMRTLQRNPRAANVALVAAASAGALLVASGAISGGGGGGGSFSSSTVGAAKSSSGVGGLGGAKNLGALLGAAATNVADGIAGAASSAPGFRRKAPEVDAKVAEQIVRRWQSAKAQALGVAHNLRPLEQVLEGPMLQQWLTRAEDVKAHGWAWEYQLNALTVDKVEVMTPDRVMVEATLTEVAILKDRARTEDDDKYESTYRARYELRRAEEGGGVRAWKIVGGSVVY